ncbi:hypothetical protein Tco_0713633 [Tanacetum coccineum]
MEEDQAGPNLGQSHVALAGPNPEPMHDDFIATFINDKSTEEDPGKTNMETKSYQQQQPQFSQPDSGLVVPVFQKGDDPIDVINHMMSFLTACHIPGEDKLSFAIGTNKENTLLEQVDCNQGKKGLSFVKLQGGGSSIVVIALAEEENSIFADPGLLEIQTSLTVYHPQCAYQAEDLDAYDYDCDELNSAKIALMVNLSRNGSDALTEAPACTIVNKALTTELDRYKEEVKDLKEMQNVENSFSGSNAQYAEIVRLKETLFE